MKVLEDSSSKRFLAAMKNCWINEKVVLWKDGKLCFAFSRHGLLRPHHEAIYKNCRSLIRPSPTVTSILRMKWSGELTDYVNRTATEPIAKSTNTKRKSKSKKTVHKDTIVIKGVYSEHFWPPYVDEVGLSSSWKGDDVKVVQADEEELEELLESESRTHAHSLLIGLVRQPDSLDQGILQSITSIPSIVRSPQIMEKLIKKDLSIGIPWKLADSPKYHCLMIATLILWAMNDDPPSDPQYTCEGQSRDAAHFEASLTDIVVPHCLGIDRAVYDLMYGLYIKALIKQKEMQWLHEEATLRVFRAIDADGMSRWEEELSRMKISAELGDLPEDFWGKVYFDAIIAWLRAWSIGTKPSLRDCFFDACSSKYKEEWKKRFPEREDVSAEGSSKKKKKKRKTREGR